MCGLLFEYDVRLSVKLYFAKSLMTIRTIKTSVFSGFGFCVHSFFICHIYDTIGRTAKRKSENTMKWHRVSLKLSIKNTKHKNQKQKVKPDKRLDLLFSYL